MHRFYHPSPLILQQKIVMSPTAAHHASQVMRLKPEEQIILFHDDSFDYFGIIKNIDKKIVEVYIDSKKENYTHPSINIRLFQTLTSNDKMDWIVQKSVELGVTSIHPIYSERSLIKLKGDRAEKKLPHWQQIIISACEQSGRSKLPDITMPKKISDYFYERNEMNQSHLRLILSPDTQNSLDNIGNLSPDTIDIMIGPEGGFTNHEIKASKLGGFLPVSLGPRILRTETAPLAILSLLQYKFGDFA